MGEQTQVETQAVPQVGPGGVPAGAKTSDYYKVKNIPARFDNPEWFEGYKSKSVSPMYRTSAADYGGRAPTVHTMPTCFFAKSQKFRGLGKVWNVPKLLIKHSNGRQQSLNGLKINISYVRKKTHKWPLNYIKTTVLLL